MPVHTPTTYDAIKTLLDSLMNNNIIEDYAISRDSPIDIDIAVKSINDQYVYIPIKIS